MYQTILFDLDGTLTNSELGITNSVSYALGKYGIQVPDKKALRVFIGPPLQDSFERFYGFSKEECLKAIDYYHWSNLYCSRSWRNCSFYRLIF